MGSESGRWVLVKTDRPRAGWMVSAPGSALAYTRVPVLARQFRSEAEARADACGNERPVLLQDVLRGW